MDSSKVLVILEVSQKQAYVFSSNKLKDNITNSGIIARVTSSGFFEETAKGLYNEKDNLVYAGGGHTILQFADQKSAVDVIKKVTTKVLREYPGLELFAKQHQTEGEPTAEDLKILVDKLEAKKSVRRASFCHGSFGIEATDTNTRKPVRADIGSMQMPEEAEAYDRKLAPKGYHRAFRFEDLGGTKDDKNMIAVIHIDGNAMGKRIDVLRESLEGQSWDTLRATQRKFSEEIDADFSGAYMEMCETVSAWLQYEKGTAQELSVKADKNGTEYFPVRRIISAGDDMCFVTEGRIGLECARIFLERIACRTNPTDHKTYAACAGVAIVHQKYPFYRAYKLAEDLCGNAKKYIVTAKGEDASQEVSAIDWHMELGEMKDSINDIRKDFKAADGSNMVLRPYVVVNGSYDFPKEKMYAHFRELVSRVTDGDAYARGKYKMFREQIRRGQEAARNYQKANLLDDPALKGKILATKEQIKELQAGTFRADYDTYIEIKPEIKPEAENKGENQDKKDEEKNKYMYSILFDALEMMDTFIPVSAQAGTERGTE